MPKAKQRIAFALGGLGSANGHGVGFLKAARDADIQPDMISCTSGMIYWVWRWMVAESGTSLESEFTDWLYKAPSRLAGGSGAMGLWQALGLPGVFRSALPENLAEFWRLPFPGSVEEYLARLAPARQLIPERPDEVFAQIAAAFNAFDRPIFFNSYALPSGVEHLHMNPPARALYDERTRHHLATRPDNAETEALRQHQHLPLVAAADVTPQAVKNALWLFWYGFGSSNREQGSVDGAYVRQFILSELSRADILFIPHPQSPGWQGGLPSSAWDVLDLQTELRFNESYREQLVRMDFVNRLLDSGKLSAAEFHRIRLIPVEVQVQRGFFSGYREDVGVYRDAVKRSGDIFAGCFAAEAEPPPPATPEQPAGAATGEPAPGDSATGQSAPGDFAGGEPAAAPTGSRTAKAAARSGSGGRNRTTPRPVATA